LLRSRQIDAKKKERNWNEVALVEMEIGEKLVWIAQSGGREAEREKQRSERGIATVVASKKPGGGGGEWEKKNVRKKIPIGRRSLEKGQEGRKNVLLILVYLWNDRGDKEPQSELLPLLYRRSRRRGGGDKGGTWARSEGG